MPSENVGFSLQKLMEILNASIFDAAYDHFNSTPNMPFVCVNRAESANTWSKTPEETAKRRSFIGA